MAKANTRQAAGVAAGARVGDVPKPPPPRRHVLLDPDARLKFLFCTVCGVEADGIFRDIGCEARDWVNDAYYVGFALTPGERLLGYDLDKKNRWFAQTARLHAEFGLVQMNELWADHVLAEARAVRARAPGERSAT